MTHTRTHTRIRTYIASLLTALMVTLPLGATTYHVNDYNDLVAIATNIAANNGYEGDDIVLNADIAIPVNTYWQAIGTAANPFQGHFDGQGHLISGIGEISGSGGYGVFGYIGENGHIENLGVSEGTIIAYNKRGVGPLAGVCAGVIENCWSMAQITLAGHVVGGLVGELKATGSLTDVYSVGPILSQSSDTVGALVGFNNGGTITRAYTTGYAKNGKGFVGTDKAGMYQECYYDRKLYFLEPGASAVTPVDTTSHMFTLFNNPRWIHSSTRYPQLETFKTTDASILSVAPLFIDSTSQPIDHANDLLYTFTLDTADGIIWVCQKEDDTTYIQIKENQATVKRPCTDKEIFLDAMRDVYIHTFYLRPRRVDDLQLDSFHISGPQEFCFNDLNSLPSMPSIKDGTPEYHHRIVLDSLDSQTNTRVFYTVLADDDDPAYDDYTTWSNKDSLPTSVVGRFFLRFYIHDEGCVPNWIESKNLYEYIVYPEVVQGTILGGTNRIDTLFAGDTIHLNGTATTGGKPTVHYQWFCNNNTITDSVGLNLIGHQLTDTGTFVFTRASADSLCYTNEENAKDDGSATVKVIYPFDPGAVTNAEKQVFCTVTDAKEWIITDTLASGDVEELGYEYQWYQVIGTDTTVIAGATDHSLTLATVDLQAGKTYTFFRKARNNWWRCDTTESRGNQEIQILLPYHAGELTTQADTVFAGTSVDLNGTACTGGLAPYNYQWFANGVALSDSTHQNMANHVMNNIGVYVYTRASADSKCSENNPELQPDNGSISLLVIAPFDAGAITNQGAQTFCTADEAKEIVITENTAVSGGVVDLGYAYQWYQTVDAVTTEIAGATDKDLNLATLTLEAGKTYTFTRKARNNWHLINWTSSAGEQTVQILEAYVAGSIENQADTILLNTPSGITINGTPSTGGLAPYSYQWYCNNEAISGETEVQLTSYTLPSETGNYIFTRSSADAQCQPLTPDNGIVTVLVYAPFDAGAITNQGAQTFCTVDEAKEIVITENTAVSGGVVDLGYLYQWYQTVDAVSTEIAGATSKDLALSTITLEAGKTYTFTRKARNNWWKIDWTASAGEQTVSIRAAVNAGEIETKDYGLQCTDATTFDITLNETTPVSGGEEVISYEWRYELDGAETVIATTDALAYTLTLDEANAGRTYTFRRYVRQGTCEWQVSAGQATFEFGHEEHHTRSFTICADKLPYTLTRTREDGTSDSHTFTADNETWVFITQNSAGCQSDTTFTCHVKPVPQVTIAPPATICQENNQMPVEFEVVSGNADYFHITYGNELAALLGKTDTAGFITDEGTITILSVPVLSEATYSMEIIFSDSESGDTPADYCYTAPQTVTFNAQISGYVHTKFDRILFVDNNPENGEQPAPKLSFKAYQWFKDGVLQEGQIGQYYHEDGALLNGSYYVLLTDTAGHTYRSCPVVMTPSTASGAAPATVYPVPANTGEVITVVCNNADVTLLSTSGERVLTRTDVTIQTQFNAPPIPGFYVIQIAHKDGRVETHKLIVK